MAEHGERDEREYYDPLLDDIDLKSIVEDDNDEETLRSQEELMGVTKMDSTKETQVTLVVLERPGNPGKVWEDGHSHQELPVTTTIRQTEKEKRRTPPTSVTLFLIYV